MINAAHIRAMIRADNASQRRIRRDVIKAAYVSHSGICADNIHCEIGLALIPVLAKAIDDLQELCDEMDIADGKMVDGVFRVVHSGAVRSY